VVLVPEKLNDEPQCSETC